MIELDPAESKEISFVLGLRQSSAMCMNCLAELDSPQQWMFRDQRG